MKAVLLLLSIIALTPVAEAKLGYYCGTTDTAQKFIYKHTNLKYLKGYVVSQCRALSDRPEYCGEAICQSYEIEAPAPAPRVNRRAPARRQPAPRAPRIPRGADPCDYDARCGAVRAARQAEEQIKQNQIDRMLRDYRDGKLHR
jgi:hypothetical protein